MCSVKWQKDQFKCQLHLWGVVSKYMEASTRKERNGREIQGHALRKCWNQVQPPAFHKVLVSKPGDRLWYKLCCFPSFLSCSIISPYLGPDPFSWMPLDSASFCLSSHLLLVSLFTSSRLSFPFPLPDFLFLFISWGPCPSSLSLCPSLLVLGVHAWFCNLTRFKMELGQIMYRIGWHDGCLRY